MRMRNLRKLSTLVAVLGVGCTVESVRPDDGDDGEDNSHELEGAGGRELLVDWPAIDIPYSENAKMLNFEMLRNEVKRVTGRSWVEGGVDQWALHRTVL